MKAVTGLLAVLLMLSCPSLAQTAAAPAQQAAAPAASTPSTEAAGASAGAAPAIPFVSGAKLFVEPMDGFEEILSHAMMKKKVPVVLVYERAEADFVMSGEAHVKKPGFLTGMVLSTHGKGSVSITDARTGNVVFTHKFKRADSNLTVGEIYRGWADGCAKDLKKMMTEKK